MGILMVIQLALNIAGINLVALLNQVSVWWHIAIVAAVVVARLHRRQARPVRPDPVRDPAPGRGRQLEERPRRSSTSTTAPRSPTRSSSRSSSRCCRPTGPTPATTRRPTSPRRPSAPASRARGASSCRSPCRRVVGLHLPARPDDPPAEPVDALPGDPRRRRSRPAQPVLLRRRRRRHRDPQYNLAARHRRPAWRPASPSRWRSAACRRSPPPAGCSSRSAATTGSRRRAGSRRSRTAIGRRPTR